MSIAPIEWKDKHCFVYCGPERCDCKNGHPNMTTLSPDTEKSGKTDVLLPCPFCGGEAEYRSSQVSEDCMEAWVQCIQCFCSTEQYEDAYAPRAQAIAAWNRRPTVPSGDVLTDEEIIRIACDAVVREDEAAGLTPLDPYLDRRDRAAAKHKLLSTASRLLTAAGYEIRRPSVPDGAVALREALEGFLTFNSEDYDRQSTRAAALIALKKRARQALASMAEQPSVDAAEVRSALEEAATVLRAISLDRKRRGPIATKALQVLHQIAALASMSAEHSPAHGEGALREALEPFAKEADEWEEMGDTRPVIGDDSPVTVGDLRRARSALASSAGEPVQKLHELPALSDNTVRHALEEAHKAVKLLEDLTACGSDDDYVSGVQSKITAALTALSAPDGGTSLQKAQTTPPLHPHRPA